MSGHVEEAHEEVYNRLSDLRWSTLRHYASFFCGLPSTDRRNKHDLIYWIIRSSPPSVLDRLLTFAAEASQQADTHIGKRTHARDGTDEDEPAATRVRAAEAVDSSSFLEVPTDAERRHCYRSFYDATSNEALGSGVCGVCGRHAFLKADLLKWFSLHAIPNRRRLAPAIPHPDHDLFHNLLLEPLGTRQMPDGFFVRICCHCDGDLKNGDLNRPPSFPEQLLVALVYPRVFVFKLFPRRVNNFYLGSDNPSLQRAMRGNVCSYELDAPGIAETVQGNLMPRRPEILASVIQITLFGQRRLPENWMRNLFRVRRNYIREALVWLKANNPRFYGHIRISSEHLDSLPDDGVPLELMAIARHVDDPDLVHEQNDSYIPGENDEIDSDACNADVDSEEGSISDEDDLESVPPEVFPIQVSGAIDTDLTSMSAPDLLRQGLSNLCSDSREPPYGVHC
ncbi:hypothetical protein F5887DRAFT_1071301 [Amanita rubescens]|nr:hypothetical protein F5887DRAFT_1071301 [Amanita rubescens]